MPSSLELRLLEQIEQNRRDDEDADGFYKHLNKLFMSPSGGDDGTSNRRDMRITVAHEGLARIQVRGLEQL